MSCDECSGRLGPNAHLLVCEVVQGGRHEECLLLHENIMRNKQERTREFKQQAGTGIWHCDMPKDAQKQQHKKVATNKRNRNWQGSRRNDVEAVNQVFGANKVEIKQKSLEALRLLRQADHALDKICKHLAGRTEYVSTRRSTNTRGSAKVKLEMTSDELTRKQDSCLSQLDCHTSE